jgi:hypothetical protein
MSARLSQAAAMATATRLVIRLVITLAVPAIATVAILANQRRARMGAIGTSSWLWLRQLEPSYDLRPQQTGHSQLRRPRGGIALPPFTVGSSTTEPCPIMGAAWARRGAVKRAQKRSPCPAQCL